MNLTTIAITPELRDKLKKYKVHRKDSYIDIIERLIKVMEKNGN